MTAFPAIGHVAVTVRDLDTSRGWYRRLFDAEPVLDEPTDGGFHHTVFAVGGTLLGLHQHPSTSSTDAFDEHRIGLDHVAFGCASRTDLEAWASRLDELGVPHGGIVDAHYGSGLSFRDPDNIALEFFTAPS